MATSYNVPKDWSETEITLEQYEPPNDWSDTEVVLRAGNVSLTGQPVDVDYTESILVRSLATPSLTTTLADTAPIQPRIDVDLNTQISSTSGISLEVTPDISTTSDSTTTLSNVTPLISTETIGTTSDSTITSSSVFPLQAVRVLPEITGQGSITTISANPIVSDPFTTSTSTDNITSSTGLPIIPEPLTTSTSEDNVTILNSISKSSRADLTTTPSISAISSSSVLDSSSASSISTNNITSSLFTPFETRADLIADPSHPIASGQSILDSSFASALSQDNIVTSNVSILSITSDIQTVTDVTKSNIIIFDSRSDLITDDTAFTSFSATPTKSTEFTSATCLSDTTITSGIPVESRSDVKFTPKLQKANVISTQINTSLKSISSIQKANAFALLSDPTASNLLFAQSKDIDQIQSETFRQQSILSQSLDVDATTSDTRQIHHIDSNPKDIDLKDASVRQIHHIDSKSLDIDDLAGITGNEMAIYPKARDIDINQSILNPERHIPFEADDIDKIATDVQPCASLEIGIFDPDEMSLPQIRTIAVLSFASANLDNLALNIIRTQRIGPLSLNNFDDLAYENLIFSSLSPDAKDIDQSQSLGLNKKQRIESKSIIDKDISDIDIHKISTIELINSEDTDITALNLKRNQYLISQSIDVDQTLPNLKTIQSISSNPIDTDISAMKVSKVQKMISQSLDIGQTGSNIREIQYIKPQSIDIDYAPRSLYLPIRFRSLNPKDIDQIETPVSKLRNISVSALDPGQSTSQISRIYKPPFTTVDSDIGSGILTRKGTFAPITQSVSIADIETVESGINILIDAPADAIVETEFEATGQIGTIYSANGFITIDNNGTGLVDMTFDPVSNSVGVSDSASGSLTLEDATSGEVEISNNIDESIILTDEQLALLVIDDPVSDTLSKVTNPIDGYIQ